MSVAIDSRSLRRQVFLAAEARGGGWLQAAHTGAKGGRARDRILSAPFSVVFADARRKALANYPCKNSAAVLELPPSGVQTQWNLHPRAVAATALPSEDLRVWRVELLHLS